MKVEKPPKQPIPAVESNPVSDLPQIQVKEEEERKKSSLNLDPQPITDFDDFEPLD